MSRVEALQAVEKLNEASSLKIDDTEVVQELAEIRIDVEKNVKRKFIGNWALLGLLVVAGVVNLGGNAGGAVLMLLFSAAYYAVNLAPQYAINARVLKGESAIKRTFFDMIQDSVWWLQLIVYAALFMLLPVFMVYWGIRNWTGQNAPLGKAVEDIHSKHSGTPNASSADEVSPAEGRALSPTPLPASPAQSPHVDDIKSDIGGSPPATAAKSSKAPVVVKEVIATASEATAAMGKAATIGFPAGTKVLSAFALPNKTMTAITVGVVALVLAVGAFYLFQSRKEDQLRAELEQKAAQLQLAEARANASAEEARRQADDARRKQSDQAARAEAAAEAARSQQQVVTAPQTEATSVDDQILQPRIRVGDRHTFETLDMVDSRLNNVVAREVVSISGDEVTMKFINQKSSYERLLTYDRDLGLVRSRFGQGDGANYSPAIKYVKVPGRIGESWVSKSTETNIKTGKTREHVINGRIAGKETVTVPAGTFETFRIVIESEVHDDGKVSKGWDMSWFAPQVGRSVKSDLRSKDPAGKEGHRVVQLLSYSQGQ